MTQNYLCISIPEELQEFLKAVTVIDEINEKPNNFGVETIKDELGNITCTAYYSNSGELIKRVYYNGSSVSSIEHYRNNILYSQENYSSGKIIKKTLYNTDGEEINEIKYKYEGDRIIYIQKKVNDEVYSVDYGYDELNRVNSRIIKSGSETISEQLFRYDILDRIVEYRDSNQCISVHKVNSHNELISYTIRDAIGNIIEVNNKYMCTDYIGTEITINGHKTTVKDRMYVDNVMLKKPYTNEDDLDFALSNQIKVPKISSLKVITSQRNNDINSDKMTDFVIMNKKDNINLSPMSADNIKFLKF